MPQDEMKWAYCGDMDPERGGLFYEVSHEAQVAAVSLSPLDSSVLGGDAWRVIFDGTVACDDRNLDATLASCGYERASSPGEDLRIDTPDGVTVEGEAALRLRIEAFHAYDGINDGAEEIVSRRAVEAQAGSLAGYLLERAPYIATAEGAPNGIAQDIDWYARRGELEEGQTFRHVDGGLVQLDRRVEGDGTQWEVETWSERNETWLREGDTIEPGDLVARAEDPEDADTTPSPQ